MRVRFLEKAEMRREKVERAAEDVNVALEAVSTSGLSLEHAEVLAEKIARASYQKQGLVVRDIATDMADEIAPTSSAAEVRAAADYQQNYTPRSHSTPVVAATKTWEAGLLELPFSEDRRATLAVRASGTHLTTRLQDHTNVASRVHSSIVEVEGTQDAVLTGMIIRHLERCSEKGPERGEDLRADELAHLLAILIGVDRATRLTRLVVAFLEEGMQESWYEAKLRKKYASY
jgi:hypothetical protein